MNNRWGELLALRLQLWVPTWSVLAALLVACGGGQDAGDAAVDKSPPDVTAFFVSGKNALGEVRLEAKATDNVQVTAYCFATSSQTPNPDDACFTESSRSPFIRVTKNEQEWFVWARDKQGLVSAAMRTVIARDITSPSTPTVVVEVKASNRTVQLRVTNSSDATGVAAYCFRQDAGTTPLVDDACFGALPTFTMDLPPTASRFYVWAKDYAGNVSARADAYAGCSTVVYDAALRSSLPVVCFSTSLGEYAVELEPQKAPATTENFLRYVREDFYRKRTFHRIIQRLMVQGGSEGGDPSSNTQVVHDPIVLESTDKTGLKNLRGTIAMARTNAFDSATSGFFINVADNDFWNFQSVVSPGYAPFGRVIHGLDTTIESIRNEAVTGELANNPPIIYWAYQLK